MLTDIANRAMLAQQDKVHLDGSVSALRWLVGEDRFVAGRGQAVDLGITVAQALDPALAAGDDPLGARSGDGGGGDVRP